MLKFVDVPHVFSYNINSLELQHNFARACIPSATHTDKPARSPNPVQLITKYPSKLSHSHRNVFLLYVLHHSHHRSFTLPLHLALTNEQRPPPEDAPSWMFKAFWVIIVLKALLLVGRSILLYKDIREYRREMREQAALDAEKGLTDGLLFDDGHDGAGSEKVEAVYGKEGMEDLKEAFL